MSEKLSPHKIRQCFVAAGILPLVLTPFPPSAPRRNNRRRRLVFESLEPRSLLAGFSENPNVYVTPETFNLPSPGLSHIEVPPVSVPTRQPSVNNIDFVGLGLSLADAKYGKDVFAVNVGPISFDVGAFALDIACTAIGLPSVCGSLGRLLVAAFEKSPPKHETLQNRIFSAQEANTAHFVKELVETTVGDRIVDPELKRQFTREIIGPLNAAITLAEQLHPFAGYVYDSQQALIRFLQDNPKYLPSASELPSPTYDADHIWDTDRATFNLLQGKGQFVWAAMSSYSRMYGHLAAPSLDELYVANFDAPRSPEWPASNHVYELLQPLVVAGEPIVIDAAASYTVPFTDAVRWSRHVAEKVTSLDAAILRQFPALLSSAEAQAPLNRLNELVNRATSLMTVENREILYASSLGHFHLGKLLLPSSLSGARELALLNSHLLLLSHLSSGDRLAYTNSLSAILAALPAVDKVTLVNTSTDFALLLNRAAEDLPDSHDALTTTADWLVASPNLRSLLTVLNGLAVPMFSMALPVPTITANTVSTEPLPHSFRHYLKWTDITERLGTVIFTTHDTAVVGGTENGPRAGGGAITLPIGTTSPVDRVFWGTVSIDTGGGLGSGRYLGKQFHSKTGAPILVFLNGHLIHTIRFPEKLGMYNERWATSPYESHYTFSFDASDLGLIGPGPLQLTMVAGDGSIFDIRSADIRFNEVPVFSDSLPAAPELDNWPLFHTQDLRPEISWSNISNAEKYELLVTNAENGTTVLHRPSVRARSYTPVIDWAPGTYLIWVRAINSLGDSPWSSPQYVTTGRSNSHPSKNDSRPIVSIQDGVVAENSHEPMHFYVTLSEPSTIPVFVDYSTQNPIADIAVTVATPGSDYIESKGTIVFPPGYTALTIAVPIVDDSAVEQDEVFGIRIANARNALIGRDTATGTILSDHDADIFVFFVNGANLSNNDQETGIERLRKKIVNDPTLGPAVASPSVFASDDSTLAPRLDQFLEQHNAEPSDRIVIIGFSHGGQTAYELASALNETVDACILIDPIDYHAGLMTQQQRLIKPSMPVDQTLVFVQRNSIPKTLPGGLPQGFTVSGATNNDSYWKGGDGQEGTPDDSEHIWMDDDVGPGPDGDILTTDDNEELGIYADIVDLLMALLP